ncbi:MAG: hypothetical protein K5931_01050 [Lachnospiraceae bacterium]|nr:hypothetical protein [Lachnospiraceae bacterium]
MIEDNQFSEDVLYSDPNDFINDDNIERKKRAARRSIRKKKKRKKQLIKLYTRIGVFFFVSIFLIFGISLIVRKILTLNGVEIPEYSVFGVIAQSEKEDTITLEESSEPKEPEEKKVYYAELTDSTKGLGGDVIGAYGILVDVENNTILGQRDCMATMYPASMTKVLTLLVACEHINDLDDKYKLKLETLNYAYNNDCSCAGFAEDETVTVRDLLYGTILPSGGDAAVGLACYVAGSHEAFVELMNQKLVELGLGDSSHFTNCVGLFAEDHYTTTYGMAMIMEAAMDNEICREVLSARKYTTSSTEQHPNGIELSNWFLRRIEDKECGVTILGGKTGFVNQSGNCAVSYAETPDGKGYVCVIGQSQGSWRCIYDHVAVYSSFFSNNYQPPTEQELEEEMEEDKLEEQNEAA